MTPYIGEIRMFAGNFEPAGWAFCDGRTLPISENDTLFTIIGTTYGGDGENTFNLPDLRGRIPLHQGNGFIVGDTVGVEAVALTVSQIPAHTHPLVAAVGGGNAISPEGNLLAEAIGGAALYIEDTPLTNLNPQAISPAGGSQPHDNMQPFLCVNFIISLYGLYPQP